MTTRGTKATRRATWLAIVVLIWIVAITWRLISLQVLRHAEFRAESDGQVLKLVEIGAPRGGIYDRHGRPLALTVPVDSVSVNPAQAPEPQIAAGILSPILGLNQPEVETKLKEAARANRRFLWIERKVSFDKTQRLRGLKLGWIQLQPDSSRVYPNGGLAAHVVGSVDHLEHGDSGLEQSLGNELKGKPGSAVMVRDVVQRGVDSRLRSAPLPGKNITLTIDERLQYVAERELANAVTKSGSTSGSVVAMNPENGEILALASFPGFDANRPPRSTKELELRMNHAVSVPFEPGSVFKIVTLTAALETTKLRPDTIIPCGGGVINLFGRVIHDHDAYAALSMADVLAKSSNIGAIQIGLKVGPQNMLDYVRRFGFGRRTELPLPAESPGKVRDLRAWGKTSLGSVAMGHEISTTTTQLAQAVAVIANGGRLVKPRLILSRQRPGGKVEAEPIETPRPVIRAETAITMRQLMEGVVLHGTGASARLTGYTSGGKTGTAQIYDPVCRCYTHRYNASFAGFAPVVKPAVVVVVTINGAAMYGATIAAPVFREVATTALRLLDVPKDLPDVPPPQEESPVRANDLAIADLGSPAAVLPEPGIPNRGAALELWGPRVPDFYGKTVKAVMQESAGLGLPVELMGTGIVRAQAPEAGSILPRGERVRIQFAR